MSSAPPSWVWATLKKFTIKYSKGGVAFRGADVARLFQHLLGEDEAESGVSLQSLRSKLSPFLDSTSQTMSITALPSVLQHLCLITLTHHQCDELLTRGEGCSGSSSLLEVRGACNVREVAAGAVVLSGSGKVRQLEPCSAMPRGCTSRHGDDLAERSTSKSPQSEHGAGRINAAMGKKCWSRKAR